MEIIQRNPLDLVLADYNPRKISEKDFKQLKKSLAKFECVEPIIVNKHEGREDVIVGGHQRLKAMLDLGWKEVPTIEVDLDLEAEKELNVRLNKNTGEFDFELLTDLFDTEMLESIGFELDELPNIIEELTEGLTDPDEAPEPPKEPKTKLGDIYELGNHRLMCGDSTSIDAVEKLMNGKKADMVFTDPPYGVEFKSGMSDRFDVLMNDDKMLDIYPVVYPTMKDNSVAFVWTSHHVYIGWRSQFSDIYANTIIWSKGGGGMGDLKGNYALDYEMALFCKKGSPEFKGKRGMAVWGIPKDAGASYLHPTQKPTALAKNAIYDFTEKKESVLDLFGGSGSTLIACEETGRKARLMELDPKYCDVIVERWEKFTGKKAKLLTNVGQ